MAKIKNILKRIFGWASIAYFIWNIYFYIMFFLTELTPFTEHTFNYYVGWFVIFIGTMIFHTIAIWATYLWQKKVS